MAEKSFNAFRIHFQRKSPRDLDLCSMNLKIHRYTVLANVYTLAKFNQDRIKNDREITTSDCLFCVLVTLTFNLRNPKCIQPFYKTLNII